MAGGAAMFQFGAGSGQDIGQRNVAAVTAPGSRPRGSRSAPPRPAATSGRTLRVHVGADISITVREAGGREQRLLGPATAPSEGRVA